MDSDRVEGLLTLVRETEPLDDGFTEMVMSKLQPSKLRSFKRFITRPMILAAATLFIASAAVAAIQQTEILRPSIHEEDKTSVTALPKPPPSQEISRTEPSEKNRKDSYTSTDRKSEPSQAEKPGGYSSSHTAYFSNGRLRLETETFTNSVQAGAPHKIVLTLQNLTDERIAVYGPKGCMLQATVYSENSGNKTQMTFCPGSSRPTKPGSEREVVFIEPRGKLTSEITIFLPEPGGWFVTGLCPCEDRQVPGGDVEPAPLLQRVPSPLLRGEIPSIELGEPTFNRSGRLVTPQIRMEAR